VKGKHDAMQPLYSHEISKRTLLLRSLPTLLERAAGGLERDAAAMPSLLQPA